MNEREPRPLDCFGFTEKEELYDRVSDARFQAMVEHPGTTVHDIHIDTNSFGEFLFVTMSCEAAGKRAYVTFFGLGFHDAREKWITESWSWFETYSNSGKVQKTLSKDEARALIQERRNEVAGWVTHEKPSNLAILFAILADLTDEDGALTEMQDMEDLGHLLDLFDNEDE